MGQKDMAEKMLADYNDVFADIVNVLLFNGERIVDENGLENTKDKSQFKVSNSIHEEERDVSKVYKGNNVRIALLGLEHQTDSDRDEPLRVIAYDGVSYKAQLLSGSERYPVVTMVLYFGTKRWTTPKSIYEALRIDECWKPYVNDYRINLFEIAYLTPEQVNMFTSDFKIVADYFVQKRINKDYIPTEQTIKHVDAVLKLMSVMTGDDRFEYAQNACRKGGEENMSEALLDRIENRGIIKGKIEGKIEMLCDLGYSVEDISKKLNMSVDEVEKVIASLEAEAH